MPQENQDVGSKNVVVFADATSLVPPITGVGKYALNILRELDHAVDIKIYYFHGQYWTKNISRQENKHFKYLRKLIRNFVRRHPVLKNIVRRIRGIIFKWVSFWATAKLSGKHIFYSPNYKLPYNNSPKVIVIHDLCSERLPHLVEPETLKWLSDLNETAQEAEGIIAISEFTRQEIISLYDVPEEKIRVAYPGIDKIFSRQNKETVSSVLQKYGLDERPYFIAVSTLHPRKNISTLLEAYLSLPEDYKKRTPLLLIGDNALTHLQSIQGKGLLNHPSIIYLGYVPDEDLPALYSGALAYCSSSLYEGFGIPVAEAFSCGTSCLLSDIPPYHEISHHKDTFFDPMDAGAWAQGLKKAIDEPEWIRSKTIDERILRERFNWKQTISLTLDMLSESAR